MEGRCARTPELRAARLELLHGQVSDFKRIAHRLLQQCKSSLDFHRIDAVQVAQMVGFDETEP